MKKLLCLLLGCTTAVVFFSCSKKNSSPAPVALSTEEFIRYTINGGNYSFNRPADTLRSSNFLNNPQPPPTTSVYANRIPESTSDYAVIHFERTGVSKGSTPTLSFFYTGITGLYPQVTSSTNPVNIIITEYGQVGEYIAGNFSGLFKGPPPNNNQYNVTCNFRVKRKV